MPQAEFETKLNRVCLHIYKEKHYEEDYQMPMLRRNKLDGILEVDGCEVEGRARYTYEISGMVSMKSMYSNTCIKKKEIYDIVTRILEVTETLQKYMLNPNCLVLKPEYIFNKEGQWSFCYFPDMEEDLCRLFHELTEYFVRMLDYEDTEGIFLAYELHKATLQEHYDLELIMREYKLHETERKKTFKEKHRASVHQNKEIYKNSKSSNENAGSYGNNKKNVQNQTIYGQNQNKKDYQETSILLDEIHPSRRENSGSEKEDSNKGIGNIFYLTDEEEKYGKEQSNKIHEKYEPAQNTDTIREKGGWWKSWRKAANGIRRKRWGSWEDLILETLSFPIFTSN